MNRVEILNSVRKLVKSPDLWPQIRSELTPAMRKFRPKSFEALTDVGPMKEADIVKGYRGVHDTFPDRTSTIGLREVEPFSENINTDTKTVLHELIHEKQIRNPEFKRDLKQGEIRKVFDQDKEGLAYPDYTGIRTRMHNPEEMTAETLSRHMLAPETLKNLPEAIRKKVPQWFEKYRVVPITAGAAGAGAISFVDPSESRAAVGMKEAVKMTKGVQKALVSNWEADMDTTKLLKGSEFKGKVVAAVYRPPSPKANSKVQEIVAKMNVIKEEQATYNPKHSMYKKLDTEVKKLEEKVIKLTPPDRTAYMGGEKRVITFDDGSHINMDKDDLRTIITRKGLQNYMDGSEDVLGYEASTPFQKGKMALRSVQMRDWYKDSYADIDKAREFRKLNARHQMDLFGKMVTPVETVEFEGKFFNIPEPYVKHLKEFKARLKEDLPNTLKLYKGRLPKSTVETLRKAESLKFFGDRETTFIPSMTFHSKRDWTNVPKELEAI
jgi:hypothetical protein